MSDMHDPYEDQLAAARYKAELDHTRQLLAGLMKSMDDLDDENEHLRDMLNDVAWKLGIGHEVHYFSNDNYAECHKRVLDEICKLSVPTSYDVAQVTTSAYDLLPEEDRDTIAWVREQGGLEEVQKRLMPEVMEWPRFEDNEPVAFGDYAEIGDCIGPIVSVTIHSADNTSLEKPAYDLAVLRSGFVNHSPIEPFSVRVKRPKVLAADGEPLCARETVWGTKGGSYHLTSVHDGEVFARHVGGSFGAEVESAGGSGLYRLRADKLTHQRPVLDAKGVPIHEGETVYANGNARGNGAAWRVLHIDPGISHPLYCEREDGKPGVARSLKPEWVTHERPDSWERIEEDLGDEMAKQQCGPISPELACKLAGEFVRRCRALAERGE